MIRKLVPAIAVMLGLVFLSIPAFDASAQLRTMEKRKRYPELIYVPSPQPVVEKMLQVAKVTKDDYVFDLGSGDGRIPITAARLYGARGLGIEINPRLVAEARANAKQAGVSDRVEFRQQDLFQTSIGDATVVALISHTPDSASGMAPGLTMKTTRSPVGDGYGQLPWPRSASDTTDSAKRSRAIS